MRIETRTVTDRSLLLGLDELYRGAIKGHERGELLRAAREVAKALSVGPADVPIEGYYSEDDELTEYFRLMRALQREPATRADEIGPLDAYIRLKEVTESAIFGVPADTDALLVGGCDPLYFALEKARLMQTPYSVASLTESANRIAKESDDFSLVGLAAYAKDSVALTALRESVVLYAELAGWGMPLEPVYEWAVDPELEIRAQRFVETFNHLFSESLPLPVERNAERYWAAAGRADILGRCVRIAYDDSVTPVRQYHWAIKSDHGTSFEIDEFWDTEVWTTERYRRENDPPHIPTWH